MTIRPAGILSNPLSSEIVDSATRRALVLLCALALGLVLGVALLPVAFRVIPNDLSRIATVLTALRGSPQVVVFGDSRAEACIDTAQLAAALPGRPLSYNLAWHAQRFAHSFALVQDVPSSARVVIVMVSLQDVADGDPGVARVWSVMRAYGFEPDAATLATMRSAFGAAAPGALTMSRLEARLDSRWGVMQFADTGLRSFFRRDLRLTREREDLFFPTAYTERVTPEAFESILAVLPTSVHPRTVSGQKRRLLERLGQIARERHLRIVLLVPATHPRLMVPDHERRLRELRDLAAGLRLEVLDGSSWLGEEDFVDPLHASGAGARKFTAALAGALGGHR